MGPLSSNSTHHKSRSLSQNFYWLGRKILTYIWRGKELWLSSSWINNDQRLEFSDTILNIWHGILPVQSILVFATNKVNKFRWFSTLMSEKIFYKVESLNLKFLLCMQSYVMNTDKETDVSWDIFIIWKINSGLWAVGWAGLDCEKVWADYEQLLRPIF